MAAPVQMQPQVQVVNAVPSGGAPFMTSLYVGDLDANVTDSQLYDMFSQMGDVVSVRVCRDLTSRRSLGYGYVNYGNPQDGSICSNAANFCHAYCHSSNAYVLPWWPWLRAANILWTASACHALSPGGVIILLLVELHTNLISRVYIATMISQAQNHYYVSKQNCLIVLGVCMPM